VQHYAKILDGIVVGRITFPAKGPKTGMVQDGTKDETRPVLDEDGKAVIDPETQEPKVETIAVPVMVEAVTDQPLTIADVVHPDVVADYVKCTASVARGWTYDGEKFAKPSATVSDADALAALRDFGLTIAVRRAQAVAEPHTRKYANAERETWRLQEDEARAVIAGDLAPADARFLMLLTDGDADTVQALAAVIIGKADQFAEISAAIIRARKTAEAGIATAKTREEVDAAINAAFAALEE